MPRKRDLRLSDHFAKPVSGGAAIGDQVRLYQGHMPWPSDVAAYYDKLDKERGLPPAKLCLGYGWKTVNG